eukprot:CAMPEP_0119404446 /NCGR_PEP_ID=MMETSP1334-20130426/143899_1 /TAXON_ID=127549 /ORGANISM="Calcidiscus leptoporus, Strain RCC1130" /LENGTH=92 /DNA_ID=CAMNT_0007428413 /DNA_START=356 /DNA_END=634 /DNA_ORIENTATION=-
MPLVGGQERHDDTLKIKLGVPQIRNQHNAILGSLMPHLVFKRVVEDQAASCLPLPHAVSHSDMATIGNDETKMASQPKIRRPTMRGQVSPGH